MWIVLLLAFLTFIPDAAAASGQDTTAWAALDQSLKAGTDHKIQALAALATIRDCNAEAIKRAQEALEDKDAQVRQAAAMALGQMKAKEAVPLLKHALDDTGEVAFAAAKALTEIGDPSGRDMLIAVLAGERKDTPGIMTNAMRDAKHRLRHPQGLILMGAEDAAGALFGPASWGIEATKDAVDLNPNYAQGGHAERQSRSVDGLQS